jgi:hypothetical protein
MPRAQATTLSFLTAKLHRNSKGGAQVVEVVPRVAAGCQIRYTQANVGDDIFVTDSLGKLSAHKLVKWGNQEVGAWPTVPLQLKQGIAGKFKRDACGVCCAVSYSPCTHLDSPLTLMML